MDTQQAIATGRRVIDIEARAVAALGERINDDFVAACNYMLECNGRVIVTGMGKSGHIGGKIAATLASTGTPAFFVHPGEASHGDLGMITGNDVVMALSNSGETPEILTILPLIKRLSLPLIALTGTASSTLASSADVHLDVSVELEACPLHLAPTSSTSATLAMGDALAIALLEANHFTRQDFALSHPGGILGRRLLLRLKNLMHTGADMPVVDESTPLSAALLDMTEKQLGMTGIVDKDGHLTGIFTDGDLRRALDSHADMDSPIQTVMTAAPKTATPDLLAAEALKMMEDHKINGLMVVDADNKPVGALNMHDLLRAGLL